MAEDRSSDSWHTATIERDQALFSELPYGSFPYVASHPDTLATVATLMGRQVPAVATARILELGCASGGNLIPMAVEYPGARLHGIDLTERHIRDGQARIAALGLSNITLDVADLLTIDFGDNVYDYIICHGVYSWVDQATQQAILRLIKRHLAPAGIAYVSYNVLPGWQQRSVIRDIFAFSDTGQGSVPDRVARGRWLLDQLAKASDQSTPYGQMLRREAQHLSDQNDSYLMSEFLVQENRPCYFKDFAADAKAAGLSWLGEAALSYLMQGAANPQLDQVVRALAGPDDLQYEQYLDFLAGRQFRQSLLVQDDGAVARKLVPARLQRLHLSSPLRQQAIEASEGAEPSARRLRDPMTGKSITTNDPAVIAAFDHLGQRSPATMPFAEVLQVAVAAAPEGPAAQVAERVAQAVLKLGLAGLCTLRTTPIGAGGAQPVRPCLRPLARQELADGQAWITSADHRPVHLGTVAPLARLFDGSRTADALAAAIAAQIEAGAVAVDLDGSDSAAQSVRLMQSLLVRFTLAGVLAPSETA